MQKKEILVKNLTEKVKGQANIMSPRALYELHKTDKLFYDRQRLQRLLVEWHDSKVNSYLFTMMIGASVKDCFQLASIPKIVAFLKKELVPTCENYEFVEENYEYFSDLMNKGYEYLVLDGQHRIDTLVRYFDNQVNFKPLEPIRYQIIGEKGQHSVAGKFEKLADEIQNYILDDINLIVIVYETGDLRELARIFITSNSMTAMTKHEKRILNYNSINRWLNNLCLNDENIEKMFKRIKSGMAGEYSLDHKGDTLFVAEMLMYINDNYYDGYDTDVLDDVLGAYPSGKVRITESDKEMTNKILKTMADGCLKYDASLIKKFTKSSYYNLFYTISYLLQRGNVWGKEKEIDGSYKIVKSDAFVKWFFDMEYDRIHAQNSIRTIPVPGSKKPMKEKHPMSFLVHNEDQKHARKQSVKDEGGSKYTFSNWARVRYLLEDTVASLKELEKLGIISKVGSRTTMSRDEALVALGVPLSQSKELHIDEIVPVSKGGVREVGNIRAIPKKQNLVRSDRDIA